MVEIYSVHTEQNSVDRLAKAVELQVNVVVVRKVHRVQQVTVPKVDLVVDRLWKKKRIKTITSPDLPDSAALETQKKTNFHL